MGWALGIVLIISLIIFANFADNPYFIAGLALLFGIALGTFNGIRSLKSGESSSVKLRKMATWISCGIGMAVIGIVYTGTF